MIRKLVVMLLTGVICLMGITPVLAQEIQLPVSYATPQEYEEATGGKIEKLGEAPVLRTMVAAGEIPSIEQRLPEEPLVVSPEEIGKYGGTLYRTDTGSLSSWRFNTYFMMEPAFQRAPLERNFIYPNVFKDYKVSDDFRTYTFFLRKGLRWSDGYPVTADDVMFWYEDVLSNDELTPVKPWQFVSGGKLVKVEKIDDYTVRYSFPKPYANLIEQVLSYWGGYAGTWGAFVPKHYLEEYHIKYNPKANELAKEEGYDYWYQLFNHMKGLEVVGRPTLQAWVLKKITTDHSVFERNPYFWKIDTAGNQLPYIDRIENKLTASSEAYKMSVIGGENDFALRGLVMGDYPLLRANQDKGGYTVYDWKSIFNSGVVYFPYQTYEDPVMRKIFQDIRFRKALSLAINREEINNLLYFGKGTPGQLAVLPGSKYHVPEFWRHYAEYDPKKANELLDEIDLRWDKEHTYRLRPDGKILFVKIEGFSEPFTPTIGTAELVRGYWGKIGIKVDFDFSDTGLFISRFFGNKVSITTHWAEACPDVVYTGTPMNLFTNWWGKPWGDAWVEGGREQSEKEGVPEDVIRLHELREEFGTATTEEEKIRVAYEISYLFDKNLWVIGTVGGSIPFPCVVKNYLRNVPKESLIEEGFQQPTLPAQYFFSK